MERAVPVLPADDLSVANFEDSASSRPPKVQRQLVWQRRSLCKRCSKLQNWLHNSN
jgi:hypothetical protein